MRCFEEIRGNIPVPLRRVRIARRSTQSHPFQVSLSKPSAPFLVSIGSKLHISAPIGCMQFMGSLAFFFLSLPNPRTLSHKSSFIPRTCNLWVVLHSSSFPYLIHKLYPTSRRSSQERAIHGMPCPLLPFMSPTICTLLNLISINLIWCLSHFYTFRFFSLPWLGLCIGHHALSSTQFTKKKEIVIVNLYFFRYWCWRC